MAKFGQREANYDALRVMSADTPALATENLAAALGVYNVRDYGAAGDGATDDTAAIQAAIDAAILVDGMVIFPSGNYRVAGSGTELLLIEGPINLVGCGWGSQIIVDASVGATVDVIRVRGPAEGLRISGLKIVPASGTPARHGINLDATSSFNGERPISKFVIEHNWIGPFGGRGICTTFPTYLDGIFNGVIRENYIYGGIYLDRAGDTLAIRDNTIAGVGPGIEVNLVDGAIAARQLIIDHNSIVSANGSITIVAGQNVIITNNNLEPTSGSTPGTNATLIDLQGSSSYPLRGTIIRDNWFSATPNTTTYHIRADYAEGTFIEGNTFGYGLDTQRAVRTTANCADIYVGPNIHLGYDEPLSLMFSTLGGDVMTHLPRYGNHRIGPIVQVVNDTQASSEEARLIVTSMTDQESSLLVVEDSDETPIFRILFTGAILQGRDQTTMVITGTAGQSAALLLVESATGAPLFRITPSGAVILAKNQPIFTLDSADDYFQVFLAGDDTVQIGFIDGAPATNGHLRFYTNGSERARIQPDTGNLLLGTFTDGMTTGGSLAVAQDLAHRGTKVGFNNSAPVAQSTGWSVTAGYTADKAFDPETAGVQEVARVLGTLIDFLKSRGDLAA
jgi:hypothetical protein